jgi:pimeloyl-ACP methyl ester carboxylesterase
MTPRRLLLLGALALGGGYLLVVALFFLGQRRLLYPAPAPVEPQVTAGRPREGALERIEAAGRVVWALNFPAAPGQPTIVHFHGNGEQLADLFGVAHLYQRAGLGFFAVEYPGYGLSAKDSPSERALYEAGEAGLDWLAQRGVGPAQVVLEGQSLGSGVAMELAARGRGSRLILLSPYTSIPELAGRLLPWLPARLMVLDRFDNLRKAPTIALPALVVHGDRDEVVPVTMGRAVAAALPHAQLEIVPGSGHMELFAFPEVTQTLIAFAKGAGR